MAITPEQRIARRRFIGSSDAPAIAGVDEHRSPMAVYLEKVFEVADLPNAGPIARGNRYEPVLLDWAAEELGVEVERDIFVPSWDGINSCNLDGRVKGKREGVEAKFTGMGAEFGEPMTDQVPDRVIIQAHHQMYVAELDLVWVPVLLARFDRPAEVMYRVERNDDLVRAVVEMNRKFHVDYILTKTPPPLSGPPALDVIRRIQREPGTVVAIESELVRAWEAAKERKKLGEREEGSAKAALLAALGDAEVGDFGDPEKWFTYYEQKRDGYTVAPTTFRVPRMKRRGF